MGADPKILGALAVAALAWIFSIVAVAGGAGADPGVPWYTLSFKQDPSKETTTLYYSLCTIF